jgi:hypothetical protein
LSALPPEPAFAVVAPGGRRGGLPKAALAPRPSSLEGLTVGFVWDHIFRGDEMFEIFAEHARERFGDFRIVDHAAFGEIHGTAEEERKALEELPELLRAHRVDAVVVGVGA